MEEQLNNHCETEEYLMVEQWNISWWKRRTSDGGKVEHLKVEQWNI